VSATNSNTRSVRRAESSQVMADSRALGPVDVLILSAWCGVVGGLLEVGTRVLCRYIDPTNRLYMLSRHFVWLVPLSNLLFFAGAGLLLALVAKSWPRRGARLMTRFIGFWSVLPALIVAGPRIYPVAWVIVAAGIGSLMATLLERHTTAWRRRLVLSLPALIGSVLILAAVVFVGDWLKTWREASRPLPPPDFPNVLLLVLDTVRADRLSLYGYERPTTPVLERLAQRGIRFDEARATAPWTLPSHASLFTGRWPHELGVQWLTPLRGNFPTLSEYLGSRGYATAGFVANTLYCSYETGLDRGFTHYEDYILEKLMPLRTAWLVDHIMQTISDLGVFVGRTFNVGPFRPMHNSWFASLFVVDRRKDARSIHRGFFDWLSRRRQPARPFFAFLNFYDAHAPYVLPEGGEYRFGLKPRRVADFLFLVEYWESMDRLHLRPAFQNLARDSYDNCVAYLDECLGDLFTDLRKRGLLEHTLIIVTSDHGEGLGEHGLFDHGESLYRNEIRVPLLIVPPDRNRSSAVVRETVSLRDLPATIVDLVGLGADSPCPGRSLAYLWRDPSPGTASLAFDGAISELPKPNPYDPNHGRSPAHRGPLTSLAEGDFAYIRNEGDRTEELFNEHDDPGELHNLVEVAAMRYVLERFRRRLDLMKANRLQRVP
jgi:arylsulfatase A-like enzyme